MNVLWMSWKDERHPHAGGAEVVKSEICRRLVSAGHQVIQVVAGFPGARKVERINRVLVIRVGGRFSVYLNAWCLYRSRLQGWAHLIIDECNTMPFFVGRYAAERSALVVYQLAREVWFHQMPCPASYIGYFAEPFYLKAVKNNQVLTIGQSSKRELMEIGFNEQKIKIIRMGSSLRPVDNLRCKNTSPPTILYLGSLRKMKRPEHVIAAFAIASEKIPSLRLVIAGGGESKYVCQLADLASSIKHGGQITFLGPVSADEKLALMRDCHLIVATSVKEGWGLIVTEAASQGTPAVVYDVDGLRDSVRHRETGLVTKPRPECLADGIVELLSDESLYETYRREAWEWSRELNFDNCYEDFCKALRIK